MANEGSKILFPAFNPVWAVLKVAPAPWAFVAMAWIWLGVSLAFRFEIPASGSVLVCGALLAETTLERLRWRTLPTTPWGTFQLVPDGKTQKPLLTNAYVLAPAGHGRLGALLSLARAHEVKIDSGDGNSYWFYKNTVERVERRIYVAIVVTAIVGTALWGYGHLAVE